MPRLIAVTIRLEKTVATRLDGVVDALRAAGLTRADVHGRFLIVNGSVRPDRLDDLRAVDGVASVREDATYGPG